MGTYYRLVNLDKREIIDLPDVANIKYGAYAIWGLQSAILNTFLGFSWSREHFDVASWCGRWAGDRIRLENDGADWEHPDCAGNWPDVGMEFLSWLEAKDNGSGEHLWEFCKAANLDSHIGSREDFMEGLQEWRQETGKA